MGSSNVHIVVFRLILWSPTNHHLLIQNIHHLKFSLGPRFAKAHPTMRNDLQAHHKKEFADMMKEEEEEKESKGPQGVKNEVFPTVA